jgi:hypothetical protein
VIQVNYEAHIRAVSGLLSGRCDNCDLVGFQVAYVGGPVPTFRANLSGNVLKRQAVLDP